MCNGKCDCETGPQEAQRLTREATKSKPGPSNPSDNSPQPGTEDVPDEA